MLNMAEWIQLQLAIYNTSYMVAYTQFTLEPMIAFQLSNRVLFIDATHLLQ